MISLQQKIINNKKHPKRNVFIKSFTTKTPPVDTPPKFNSEKPLKKEVAGCLLTWLNMCAWFMYYILHMYIILLIMIHNIYHMHICTPDYTKHLLCSFLFRPKTPRYWCAGNFGLTPHRWWTSLADKPWLELSMIIKRSMINILCYLVGLSFVNWVIFHCFLQPLLSQCPFWKKPYAHKLQDTRLGPFRRLAANGNPPKC